MDDKTAAIPSLKDFKDKQKDRSAQSQRTGTMQTKGQIRRNAQKNKKASANSVTGSRRSASKDTMRLDAKKIRNAAASQKPPAQNKKKSGPAPSSYARERIREKNGSDYDNSRRVDRSAQTNRRNNMQSANSGTRSNPAKTAQSGSARPAPSSSRPSRNNTSKKMPRKKPKKPMSPGMRKVRNIAVTASILLAVFIVGMILSLTVFFKADKFAVYGIERYSKKEVVDASGINLDENIFTANKKQAEERIERMLPYIEDAQVYSIFPDTIGVNITMAKPACKINAIGGCYIVSDKGKVLEITSDGDAFEVPLIEGVQIKGRDKGEFVDYGSETLTKALKEMFRTFDELGSTRITGITIEKTEDIFEIRFDYDNRIIVQLGLPEEISYKLRAADKIIAKLDEDEGTAIAGELDVSSCHENGRSYFDQYSIFSPDVPATEPATEGSEPDDLL